MCIIIRVSFLSTTLRSVVLTNV